MEIFFQKTQTSPKKRREPCEMSETKVDGHPVRLLLRKGVRKSFTHMMGGKITVNG